MLTALLVLILLALILIELELKAIKDMIFEARLCPECHGTGTVPEEREFAGDRCETCKGTGKNR